ncbi:unnamed protein product [Triticum turgidum subsp. durum]|uniref:PHD-type domain-containing protein n=1 Tax=Triticum turgidum subsp. durum TaxID=4567 RepID=A0A9R0TXE7_TRITD|nr:unnamed protein product [Triticum turgidum subsp. durum]
MHNMLDFIAWSYTKNGLFTIRSAYLEEWNKQYGTKLQHTNGMGRTNVNPVWHEIWKLSCPAKDRRKLVQEGKVQDALQTSMGARAITANYINAHSPKATSKTGGWSRPPMGFVKLNVDASFDHDLLRGTAGASLRDDNGRFIVGGNWRMDWCADVLTAEELALRFGLFLAQKVGAIVLLLTLTICRFEHCNRQANKVAHELARLAKFSVMKDWFEEPMRDIGTGMRLNGLERNPMPGIEDALMKDSPKASSLVEVEKPSLGDVDVLGGGGSMLTGKKRKDVPAGENGGVAKRVLRSATMKLHVDAEPEGEAAAAADVSECDALEKTDCEATAGDSLEKTNCEATAGDSLEKTNCEATAGDSLEKTNCEAVAEDGRSGAQTVDASKGDEHMDEVPVKVDDAIQVPAKCSENNVDSAGIAQENGLDNQKSNFESDDKVKADEKTYSATQEEENVSGTSGGGTDDSQENKGANGPCQGEVIDPSAAAKDDELVIDLKHEEEEVQFERRVTRSSTVKQREASGSSCKSSANAASMESKGRKEDVVHHYTRKVSNTASLKADHTEPAKRGTNTKKNTPNGKISAQRKSGVTGKDYPANITENKASATEIKINSKPQPSMRSGSIAKATTKDAVPLVDQNVCSSAITEKNDTELTDSEGVRSENKTAMPKSPLSVGAKIVASKKRMLESGLDKIAGGSPVETPSMKKTRSTSHTELDQSKKSSGKMLTEKNSGPDKKYILTKQQHHSRAAELSRSVNPSNKDACKLSHNGSDVDGTDIIITHKRNCRGRRERDAPAVMVNQEYSSESEEVIVVRKDRRKRKDPLHKQRSGSRPNRSSGSPKASCSKGNSEAQYGSRAKSGNPGESTGRFEQKRQISEQVKTILLDAGWKIDLRPRNGRNYWDSVYIPPSGKGSYWSITKAYAVYESMQSEQKNEATSENLSKKSPGSPGKTHASVSSSLPQEILSKLKRVVVNKRKTKVELQKLKKRKHGLLKNSKNSKGRPKEKKKKISKERKKRGGCALLARGSNQEAGSSNGFAPYEWKRTVFSWLIDLDVLSVNTRLKCMDESRSKVLLEGLLTRDGINCSCCSKVVTVLEFVAHAGGQPSKPYRNILVDGLDNDLLHCLISAWDKQSDSERQAFFPVSTEGDDPNDDTCGICGDGGNLICCDGCPSTFHMSCLELEEHLNHDAPDNAEVDSLHSCSQCEEKYHPACSPETEDLSSVSNQAGNHFCQQSCRLLFEELQNLLAVKKDLEPEFACRIIQCSHENAPETVLDLDGRVECNSKIAVALSLMDECFLPIVDQRTGINLIRNVVYNCGSNFLRLDFRGFYIFILERGDEIVSAASVRIHGTKLAEMPFIGTRHMYRRQGMCRRLLDGIEMVSLPEPQIHFGILHGAYIGQKFGDVLFSPPVVIPLEVSDKQEVKSINMLVFPGTGLLQKPLLNKQASPQEHPGSEGDVDADAETQGSEVMDQLNSSKEDAETCKEFQRTDFELEV